MEDRLSSEKSSFLASSVILKDSLSTKPSSLVYSINFSTKPSKEIAAAAKGKKGILVSEINAGQMIQDVKLAVNGALPVEHFGRLGGIVPDPEEIVNVLKDKLMR